MSAMNDAFNELNALQAQLEKIKKAAAVFGHSSSVPESLKKEQLITEQRIVKLRESLSNSRADLASNVTATTRHQPLAFVIMPFKNPYDSYYRDILKPAILDIGYDCVRSDEIYSPVAFLQTIWQQIVSADVMIAEMTGMNPNVLYELGLAHSISKKVIMITQDIKFIPSDLRHINSIVYDTADASWAEKLRGALQRMVLFQAKDESDLIVVYPRASVDNTLFYERLTRDREFLQERTSKLEGEIENYAAHVRDLKARLASSVPEGVTEASAELPHPEVMDDSGTRIFIEYLPNSNLDLQYVEIERGPFIFGVGASAHEMEIDTYYITRFSVTNAQYCVFLNAVGNRIEDGHHWIDLQGKSPADQCRISRNDEKTYVYEEGFGDHPVTYVNFFGASAFCAWVGGQLPTVEEWEKAVRGTDGRDYPWGNNPPTASLTNVENGDWPRDVAPIEVYRKMEGGSPFGVVQGIGNVWHWTSTYYPDRDIQAVRGGSFFDFRLGRRSVFRFLVQPDGPDFSQGFLVMKRFLGQRSKVE